MAGSKKPQRGDTRTDADTTTRCRHGPVNVATGDAGGDETQRLDVEEGHARPMTATPRFDAWRKDATRQLAPRGRKAELARHLAAVYGRPERSWERHLSAIMAGDREPKADLFLTISAWLDGTPPAAKSRTARKLGYS